MKVLNQCRVFAVLLALLLPRLAVASDIAERYSKFLLLADGDSSSGSASIVKFRGNALILTNAHVVSGNAITRFRQINSHDVRAEVFGVAQDRDIIVASQKVFTDGIEASEAVDKDVSIGDAIVVLGNSQGRNVVTEIEGKIIGLGPDLVEVDAKFVSGNSGSPIIHVKTGKVIAVATFVTVKKADAISQDTPFAEVRRFAYRIDTVPKWQYCSPDRFAEEGVFVTNIQSHTADLMTLFKDLRDDGTLDPSNYTGRSNWISGYVSTLGKGWPENRLQQLKFAQLAKEFTQHINSDIRGVNANSFTVFHRDALVKELMTRELLANYFRNVQWSSVKFESWGLQQTAWTYNAVKR